jgi:DNA polymerase-3 subunit epsilon
MRPDAPPPAMRREVEWIDPLAFARELYKEEQSRALGDMAARLGIELERAHRATDDAEAALRILYTFAKDPRVPRAYGGLIQEQRRLVRQQDEARKLWRKPN